MEEYFDYYDNSVADEVWLSLPEFISWLQSQRKQVRYKYSINLTIILQTTTLLEGFLFNYLAEEAGTPVTKNKFSDRLIIELNKRLENASWTQYVEYFELVTGKKLSALTPNETWKGINALFQFRNMVTHGKTFEVKFCKEHLQKPVVTTKYSKILQYLLEAGVVNKRQIESKPHSISLVTNEAVDFFYDCTCKFLANLYDHLLRGKNSMTKDSYRIAFYDWKK